MSHQNDLHERKSLDDGSIVLLFKAAGSGILGRLADTSRDYIEVPAAENANGAYAADLKPCVLRNPWGSSLSSAGTISQIASPGVNARMSLTSAVLKDTGACARGWCDRESLAGLRGQQGAKQARGLWISIARRKRWMSWHLRLKTRLMR